MIDLGRRSTAIILWTTNCTVLYDRSSIADETLDDLLSDSTAWDIILLVEDDTLIVNGTIPMIEYLQSMAISSQVRETDVVHEEPRRVVIPGDGAESTLSVGNGLAWFTIALSITIPVPLGVTTASSLSQLVSQSSTGVRQGATSSIDGQDRIRYEPADFEDKDEEE